MSKVVLRQIAKFNALKYASGILFNVDTNALLEDYEKDADYELLCDLLGEEMTKIVNQLSNKADGMKNSSRFPNMTDDLMNASIENNVDIERDYGDNA
jgi:hypothetical protein